MGGIFSAPNRGQNLRCLTLANLLPNDDAQFTDMIATKALTKRYCIVIGDETEEGDGGGWARGAGCWVKRSSGGRGKRQNEEQRSLVLSVEKTMMLLLPYDTIPPFWTTPTWCKPFVYVLETDVVISLSANYAIILYFVIAFFTIPFDNLKRFRMRIYISVTRFERICKLN